MRPGIVAKLCLFGAALLPATSALTAVRTAMPPMSEAAIPADNGRRNATHCLRWRSLIAKLGETYAGYQLRYAVRMRRCALSEEPAEPETWTWPWRHQDVRADLPTRHHGTYGAWEIRCSQVGHRQRCALALETAVAAGLDPETRPIPIVSHLVIDTVAGRESVLWRIHVGSDAGSFDAQNGITVEIGGRNRHETFDACGRRGCMAEAEPAVSADIATVLWLDRPVTFSISQAGAATPLLGMLPAYGFRSGLSELIRLRRHEMRAIAER